MKPNWNHIVRERLAVLRLPPAREIKIVEEVALHLDAIYEDALLDSLSAADAEAHAERSYDWRLLECELSRVERQWQPPVKAVAWLERKGGKRMETLWKDLRVGVRMLHEHLDFTLIAMLTLALGRPLSADRFLLLVNGVNHALAQF